MWKAPSIPIGQKPVESTFTPNNEIVSEAGKQIVGGSSALVGKMVRKVVVALNKEKHRDHRPALICVNQIRHKIGVMFGDPETTPGGNALRFASSLSVRLWGKDEFVKEVSDDLPAHKKISCIVKKWKVPIVGRNSEWEMNLIERENLKIAQASSWNTVATYLKNYGVLVKDKTAWVCLGVQVKTLAELQERYDNELELRLALQQEVISREIVGAKTQDEIVSVLKIDKETGEVLT
jgi:RecA/RadA recombinase